MKVLATGSSTLAATRKFRDSLTWRKVSLYLPPVLWHETVGEFGLPDLDRRLLHGGLPEPLLDERVDRRFFSEWMESYFARDVLELFGVRNRAGFLTLLRLLLIQSGGVLDVSKLASECGMSRPTVSAHLDAMAISHTVFMVRPFHGGARSEVVRVPKVYAFDTGFAAYARGWDTLRPEDRGVLWEHLVLDTIRVATQLEGVYYWRDRSGREVDFVVRSTRDSVDAVECKVRPDRGVSVGLRRFRDLYPSGRNLVVSPHETETWTRQWDGFPVIMTSCQGLIDILRRPNATEP